MGRGTPECSWAGIKALFLEIKNLSSESPALKIGLWVPLLLGRLALTLSKLYDLFLLHLTSHANTHMHREELQGSRSEGNCSLYSHIWVPKIWSDLLAGFSHVRCYWALPEAGNTFPSLNLCPRGPFLNAWRWLRVWEQMPVPWASPPLPPAEVGCSRFSVLVATGVSRGARHPSQRFALWLVNLSFLHAVGKMSLHEPLVSQTSLVWTVKDAGDLGYTPRLPV